MNTWKAEKFFFDRGHKAHVATYQEVTFELDEFVTVTLIDRRASENTPFLREWDRFSPVSRRA